MKKKDFTGIVPAQYTGKEIKAASSTQLSDDNHAKIFYTEASHRLLRVNEWHHIAGAITAHFQLIDANGQEVKREAQKSDYIRIDIPGPGSKKGDGYDWVYIEELIELAEDNVQSIGFRVRPSQNPFSNENETAHFYSGESTSTFIITREGEKVSAIIFDRNIKPNEDTSSVKDKIRHAGVGGIAMGIFSKLQWKNLARGLIRR